ncbi:MAG: hypothetical protein AAF743_11930, partial [Planctomycetota bacterium]
MIRTIALAATLTVGGVTHAQTNVTVDPTTRRSIGGVHQLDRAQFFNHWGHHVIEAPTNLGDLQRAVWSADGLNSVTGRDTYEFDSMLAAGVPEDPDRPGMFDMDALRARFRDGVYRDFITNGPRYASLREHENPILVQSGRAVGNWPNWIRAGTTMPISNGGAAYGEFLNLYLDEVVYGTGPEQGYLPVDPERFHIEIMNEPQLELHHGVTWEDVYEFHETVTKMVKAEHPQASIGGISNGEAPFPDWNPHRWEPVKRLMDEMATWRDDDGNPVQFDFWSLHPYDVHHVRSDGAYEHQVRQSPGHNEGILDLFETYSNIRLGDPKKFAITEYGSFIHSSRADDNDFGEYHRRLRQWDKAVAVKEKLMVFLNRPDRILNATPFISLQHWSEQVPTPEEGANYVIWDFNADGTVTETAVAGMFRMTNGLSGDYVAIDSDDSELQVAGFLDDATLHVVMNNLRDGDHDVQLDTLLPDDAVTHVTMDTLSWDGAQGVYEADVDVTDAWQTLTLTKEAMAVLTFELADAPAYASAVDERTFYGDAVQLPIDDATGLSPVITIDADTSNALSARLRVTFAERPDVWDEPLTILVNDHAIAIPPRGTNGYDDDDQWLVARTVDVPLDELNDGPNDIR